MMPSDPHNHSDDKWWLRFEGEQPTIDDLPTSSRAAEVRTALAMVDREREMRAGLRAEVDRLRTAILSVAAFSKHPHPAPCGEDACVLCLIESTAHEALESEASS